MTLTDPRSLRRLEDERFLTGRGRYVDDACAVGELHAVFVRSPHAHAALGAIDATEAMAMAGVRAVLTAGDLMADGAKPMPCVVNPASLEPIIVPPRYALTSGRVRYVGDPVALVVADDPVAARDAAAQVIVDYQSLPSVTELAEALADGAPEIWSEAPGNLAFRFQRGDQAAVEAAFATAAHSVSLDLVNNRVIATAMETRGAVARHDPATGRLHLEVSGQDVHGLRRELAVALGLPLDMLHVHCPDVGGGFGMKNVLYPEYPALLMAARRLGRPVRWIADRTEDFLSGVHGRDNLTTARLALDESGRFLALDVATMGNLGAYASSYGPGPITNSPASAMGGLYAIPAIFMDVRGAYTNTVPIDAYRGAGKPEASYIIERLIDVAARQTGFDRVELRRQNLIRAFPYEGALGVVMDTGRFDDNLQLAVAEARREDLPRRRQEAATRGRLLGQGIACFLETSRGQPTEGGGVRFPVDGGIDLLIGTQSNGQGLETSFAQLAAAQLGMPIYLFRVVQADTDLIATGGGHGGARSVVMAGTALRMAIDEALSKARREAARLLQTDPDLLSFEDGVFRITDGASISIGDLVRALPAGALDSDALNPADQFVFPYGCHVAEVEIDPDTGSVALIRYLAIDDYGVLINPLLTEGQVQGGLAQGIGQAMLESVAYDPDSGQLLSASFLDYAVPRADDLPWLEVQFTEHPTRRNPLGAKGAGQAGAIGAPAAIMNAIADALGVRHVDMPATPERVWRACQSRDGRS